MFSLDFVVRDYECDMQGIVNNSIYLNYLEHTRHKFLLSIGFSFNKFAQNNINLVVTSINIKYLKSLKSQDSFKCSLKIININKIFIVFEQKITIGNKLYTNAKIKVVAIDNKQKIIKLPEELSHKLLN